MISQKEKIAQLLKMVGVRQNLIAWDALNIILGSVLENRNLIYDIMGLYAAAAKELHTTTLKVERAIRYSISVSIPKLPKEVIRIVFGNTLKDSELPINSHYIAALSEVVAREESVFKYLEKIEMMKGEQNENL